MTRYYAFAAVMLAASSSAYAADWKVVNLAMGRDNRGITYVDAESVRPKGNRIRFRSEQYLEKTRFNYDRISRLSEIDCSTMDLTVLRESYHFGRNLIAFGQTPRGSTHYSSANGDHWMLRRICDRQYLSGSVGDHESASKRLFTVVWNPIPGRLAVAMPTSVPVPMPGAAGVQLGAAGGVGVGFAPR